MNIHDLLRAAADHQAQSHGIDDSLTEALTRWESDPRERRRINDLADLLDAQDALFDEALAALERDDLDAAEALVQQCLELDIEGADELQRMLSVCRARSQVVLPDPLSTTPSWKPLDDWDDRRQAQPTLHPGPEIAAAGACTSGTWRAWRTWRNLVVHTYFANREPPKLAPLLRAVSPDFVSQGVSPDITPWLFCRVGTIGEGQTRLTRLLLLALEADTDSVRDRLCEPWGQHVWLFSRESSLRNRTLNLPFSAAMVRVAAGWRSRLAGAEVGTYMGAEPERRRAADVLAPYPFTYLRPDTPLREALDQLLAGGESALPVREAGMVVGTVAIVDLVGATRDGASDQPVSAVMRKPVFAKAATPIDEVRDLLIQDSAGLVTVVDDDGTVAGHITPVTALAGHTSTPPPTSPRSSSGLITADLEDLLLETG